MGLIYLFQNAKEKNYLWSTETIALELLWDFSFPCPGPPETALSSNDGTARFDCSPDPPCVRHRLWPGHIQTHAQKQAPLSSCPLHPVCGCFSPRGIFALSGEHLSEFCQHFSLSGTSQKPVSQRSPGRLPGFRWGLEGWSSPRVMIASEPQAVNV